MKKRKVIAVTGGIGSGKSTVLEIIKSLGYTVVSCDEIIDKLYRNGKVKRRLKRVFPDCVSGRIVLKADKKKLAERVFSDVGERKKLENIMHPLVLKTAINKAQHGGKELSFVEVPLLFEGNYQKAFDGVIVVTRGLDLRIAGVKKRSDLSEEEIKKRMSAQINYQEFDLSPYTVINNDGAMAELKEKVICAIKNF